MVAAPTEYPWGCDAALDVGTRMCVAVAAEVTAVRALGPWSRSWERGMEEVEEEEEVQEGGWDLRLELWG